MDGGAWWAAVHGVAKSRTRLSDFTFTFHFHALEKDMATHSSVLAWTIPGTADPGGLPSMGSHRVGHDWSDLAVAAEYIEEEYIKNSCNSTVNTQIAQFSGWLSGSESTCWCYEPVGVCVSRYCSWTCDWLSDAHRIFSERLQTYM